MICELFLGRLLLNFVKLYLEDFRSFEKTEKSVLQMIEVFQAYWVANYSSITKLESRKFNVTIFENLLVKLIRNSSEEVIKSRSEERFQRLAERKKILRGAKR